MNHSQPRRGLVTGATGYVGSRLVPRLLADGWHVRVLTRDAKNIADRSWAHDVEVVEGDAAKPADLRKALDGIDTTWYLLHSMDGAADFAGRDRTMARDFGRAASDAGVSRIVYLSGLHPEGELSEHLASRVEVGANLISSGVPTAVLQAAVVVGAGSASFEMLRHLTDRLPVMIAPKWLDNRIQPIAVADVLDLLVAAADLPPDVSRTFDIGGPDVLTYREMIARYAQYAGLRERRVVTVPILSPRLASHWVSAVTPVPRGIARPLVDSLVHEVVVKENDLLDRLGRDVSSLMGFDAAVRAALEPDHPAGSGPLPEPGEVDPAQLTAADPPWAGPR